MKIHVFGDTGGHYTPLVRALKNIGVDIDKGTIPDGVQIIHLGDLIHKGIHTNDLVELVNVLIRNNPGQWIQLLGNHEFQHIQGAPGFWRCDCSPKTVAFINRWYENGLALSSYYVNQPVTFDIPKIKHFEPDNVNDKGILFSHAGLTHRFWGDIGSPMTAEKASAAINKLTVKAVSRPGIMLEGYPARFEPGPVWALSTSEVFMSWVPDDVIDPPFNQIHGHSPAWNWQSNSWYYGTPLEFKKHTKLDLENRVIYTYIKNALQICCDPGFSMRYDIKVQPNLVINS